MPIVRRGAGDRLLSPAWAGQTTNCDGLPQLPITPDIRMLADAENLEDLAAVPGNRLEALGGDRKGQRSIRINERWRICFVWREGAAEAVEIVDYH
jgi:proteic killer suppression protein